MLTISGYASKSVLTIGFGCRRFFNFCKAGRWCRRCIVSAVHRHVRALRIAALTGAHKHTRRPRRRRRSTVFTRSFPFGKASHQGLEIWAKGFPTLVRMGSLEERGCISSKEGSRHNYLKVTLEKWQKAMQCHHRICDDNWLGHRSDSGRKLELVLLNLWWCIRLKSVMTTDWGLVRSWPETKIHQVYCHVKSYIWLFPTKVTLSCRNFKSGPRFGMASQSWRFCGSWNGSCCWWLSPILAGSWRWLVDWSKMTSDRGTGQIQQNSSKSILLQKTINPRRT